MADLKENAKAAIEKVKEVFNNDAKTLSRLNAYLSDKTDERIIAFCSKDADKIKKELSQWESRKKKQNKPITTTSIETTTEIKEQTFAEVIATFANDSDKVTFNDYKDANAIIANIEKIIERVKELQREKLDAHLKNLKEEKDKLAKEIEELSKL